MVKQTRILIIIAALLVLGGRLAIGQHFIVLKNNEVVRADSLELLPNQQLIKFTEWPNGQAIYQLAYSQLSHIKYKDGHEKEFDKSGSTIVVDAETYEPKKNKDAFSRFDQWQPLQTYVSISGGYSVSIGDFAATETFSTPEQFALSPKGFAQNGYHLKLEAANFLAPNFGPAAMLAFLRFPTQNPAVKEAFDAIFDTTGSLQNNFNTSANTSHYDVLLFGLGSNLGFARPKTQWLLRGYIGFMSLSGPQVEYNLSPKSNPNQLLTYQYENGSGVGFYYQLGGSFTYKIKPKIGITATADWLYGQAELEYNVSALVNNALFDYIAINAPKTIQSYNFSVGLSILF